ncbi:class I SAM-dependent methyltransferase [Candidatus Parcubacteria bacterium]|nr:MAG: class I SAM-dependent methyltransferase [Candidatus Parcubacteria bacterium]
MNNKQAKKILKKVKQDYCRIGRVRQNIWPEEKSLLKKIKNEDSVLDLGCGEGRILPLLKNMKIRYLGIDNCSVLIRKAQGRFPAVNFKAADITSFKLNEKFDVILSFAVLHHIPSEDLRLKVLENVKNHLKPGGIVLMTNWRLENFKNKIQAKDLGKDDFYVAWRNKNEAVYRYYHNFNLKELDFILRKAGFKSRSKITGRNIVTVANF